MNSPHRARCTLWSGRWLKSRDNDARVLICLQCYNTCYHLLHASFNDNHVMSCLFRWLVILFFVRFKISKPWFQVTVFGWTEWSGFRRDVIISLAVGWIKICMKQSSGHFTVFYRYWIIPLWWINKEFSSKKIVFNAIITRRHETEASVQSDSNEDTTDRSKQW